jgi:hypothetical protein
MINEKILIYTTFNPCDFSLDCTIKLKCQFLFGLTFLRDISFK